MNNITSRVVYVLQKHSQIGSHKQESNRKNVGVDYKYSSVRLYLDVARALTVSFPSGRVKGPLYLNVERSVPRAANGSGLLPSIMQYMSTFCDSVQQEMRFNQAIHSHYVRACFRIVTENSFHTFKSDAIIVMVENYRMRIANLHEVLCNIEFFKRYFKFKT